MTGEREPYRVVGEATRGTIERALASDLTLTEAKVLLGVVHYLTSWSRLSDTISNRQLREITGMDERRVRRALKDLDSAGVIFVDPGGTETGGQRRAATIRIQTTTTPQSDPGSHRPGVQADPGSDDRTDPGSDDQSDPGSHRPPSEKCLSEKDPEEAEEAEEAPVCETCHGDPTAFSSGTCPSCHLTAAA